MARHKEQEDKSFGKRNVAALKQYREGETCSVCCRERVLNVVFAGFWNRVIITDAYSGVCKFSIIFVITSL